MTAVVRRLVEEDSSLVVWWGTRTEFVSALARRRREGSLPSATERRARDMLAELSKAWSEILPNEALRSRAERLLAVHPLRAADAFQLASALLWCQGETRDQGLVSFDDRLRDAAQREGFLVLPE